jgi:hypothetical protein
MPRCAAVSSERSTELVVAGHEAAGPEAVVTTGQVRARRVLAGMIVNISTLATPCLLIGVCSSVLSEPVRTLLG